MKSLEAAQLRDDEIHKVTWENAARWYQFDPFQHRTRDQSTVGALRAQATDVDTTPREYGALDHSHNLAHDTQHFIADSDVSMEKLAKK
jgi:hypothetical protein